MTAPITDVITVLTASELAKRACAPVLASSAGTFGRWICTITKGCAVAAKTGVHILLAVSLAVNTVEHSQSWALSSL